MRLGCLGCLTLLVILALVGSTAWLVIQTLQEPEVVPIAAATVADGVRAQQKIFEVVRRGAQRGDKDAEPVVLTERELNAFLSRHLAEIAELPFTDIGLRLPGGGIAEFRARLELRHLMTEPPLPALARALPASWLQRRIWLDVRVRARLEPGVARRERRYLRLGVTEFAVGRQRLPTMLLRLLLNPAALRMLRWPVSGGIEAVTIEAGRVVIRAAS